jgi:hypothetical protein
MKASSDRSQLNWDRLVIYALFPMTRTPHDQFAKHCFEPLLSALGDFTPAKPVSAEVREIDVYFEPSPSASFPLYPSAYLVRAI